MKLASRIAGIELSPTFRINAAARALAAQGVDVLDFSVGEPDFPTPPAAKDAGKAAIDGDVTKYTANEGTLELRKAIAAKLLRDNGLTYAPDAILASPGAKSSLSCAVMALFSPGDEVLVPSPYWVSYPEQIRLAGATPVVVPSRESAGFKLTAAEIDAACTVSTRGLFLNYPSNPTGACYDADELLAIAEVARRRDLVIIADEIYEKLLFDGRTFTSIASLSDDAYRRTVVVNGVSKTFAMTGWRLGYAAGPKEIVEAMAKVQSHTTSHPASISQAAAKAALSESEADVRRMAAEFAKRRDFIVEGIAALPGVTLVPPAGAFYVYPNVSGLFGRTIGGRVVRSGQDVAEALLDAARIAVVPGEAFGTTDHVRLSFACSMDRIREARVRLRAALA
ncbi:MAG TPA: pyridoxal phosphate-dependent aminotransferase [Candidatus Polarisedimenticolaceae bacterium]|nr:pyridoxal phosphate-dependent aminotransferase [Candidatus Polarisedimenticolaceae bacterium]